MALDMRKLLQNVRNTELVITPVVTDWLLQHGDDPWPDWVVDIIEKELRAKPRLREGTFSASSAGRCPRLQELAFLGMPGGDTIDPRLANIFMDGKWRHLRWQAMGLTAGFLDKIEQPMRWRKMKAYGTIDGQGTVPDDHPRSAIRGMTYGFELKGTNSFVYQKFVKREKEAKDEHQRQVARYFAMGGFDMFVTVYEDKNTQDWHEWVEFPDPARVEESMEELRLLNRAIDNERLDPMLPECRMQTGVFEECTFGGAQGPCIRSGKWPNIKKINRRKEFK